MRRRSGEERASLCGKGRQYSSSNVRRKKDNGVDRVRGLRRKSRGAREVQRRERRAEARRMGKGTNEMQRDTGRAETRTSGSSTNERQMHAGKERHEDKESPEGKQAPQTSKTAHGEI